VHSKFERVLGQLQSRKFNSEEDADGPAEGLLALSQKRRTA